MTSKTDDVREAVAREVLNAVFSGFEHGQCEKEWEPEYGKEITKLATDAILALISPAPAGVVGDDPVINDLLAMHKLASAVAAAKADDGIGSFGAEEDLCRAAFGLKLGDALLNAATEIERQRAALSAAEPAPVAQDEGAAGEPVAKPLDWRKPTKRELEEGGRDCALWIAPGFGGEYAIQADGAGFILWRIDDPYAFDTFPTVEAAKAYAEADWQKTIGRKIAAHPSPPPAAQDDRLRAWDELAKRPGWEISFSGDDEEDGWSVHSVTGGVNDREWNELARADTPLEAVLAALNPEAAK